MKKYTNKDKENLKDAVAKMPLVKPPPANFGTIPWWKKKRVVTNPDERGLNEAAEYLEVAGRTRGRAGDKPTFCSECVECGRKLENVHIRTERCPRCASLHKKSEDSLRSNNRYKKIKESKLKLKRLKEMLANGK